MSNEQNRNPSPEEQRTYEELRGYFPEEYDLTPEELEAQIRRNAASYVPQEEANDLDAELQMMFSERKAQRGTVYEPVVPPPESDLAAPVTEAPDEQPLPTEEAEETPLFTRFLREAFDILEVFVLCAACIILVFAFGARLTRVNGTSMNDTLVEGQFLIISNLGYDPTPGDIVVLHNVSLSVDQLREPLVKRIIAVGGQTVRIAEDGTVTITEADGSSHKLEQSFIKNEPYYKEPGEYVVPEGYVFVMGDNRNGSTDSRDSRVGIIDERCICGRAILRLFPFDKFTVFENPLQ